MPSRKPPPSVAAGLAQNEFHTRTYATSFAYAGTITPHEASILSFYWDLVERFIPAESWGSPALIALTEPVCMPCKRSSSLSGLGRCSRQQKPPLSQGLFRWIPCSVVAIQYSRASVFDPADGVLYPAFSLSPHGFGLGVASYLTNGFLDRAFCLFGGTFNAVFSIPLSCVSRTIRELLRGCLTIR